MGFTGGMSRDFLPAFLLTSANFIVIYCFTYASLRGFPAVAVRQTLTKTEKQKYTGRWIGKQK